MLCSACSSSCPSPGHEYRIWFPTNPLPYTNIGGDASLQLFSLADQCCLPHFRMTWDRYLESQVEMGKGHAMAGLLAMSSQYHVLEKSPCRHRWGVIKKRTIRARYQARMHLVHMKAVRGKIENAPASAVIAFKESDEMAQLKQQQLESGFELFRKFAQIVDAEGKWDITVGGVMNLMGRGRRI
ncbi:hypothetical protein L3X38_010235 [Prunus dulcis]|uniref:Uncharacterized protein n=1 Tax=Prunus dulcis TaxID=3755 RepID=A0AAD4WF69_PRUDU|nr:hypothetical protein L3X38_010235 [Prunus dulcis]